jgi:hypothetical protein
MARDTSQASQIATIRIDNGKSALGNAGTATTKKSDVLPIRRPDTIWHVLA